MATTAAATSAQPDVGALYQQYLGRQAQPNEIAFWQNQAQNGADIRSAISGSPEAQSRTNTQPSTAGIPNMPTLSNGIPDYFQLANSQSLFNLNNAAQQSSLNNPNYYGPGGSQVRTRNDDGTYSVTQTLSPQLQANYDAQNALQGKLLTQATNLAGTPLNFNNAPSTPTFNTSSAQPIQSFNTSGISPIPQADANDLAKVRDSVYQQQTQYLDPQFQQAQSDLENKLANQGIMPGSEAYNREMGNFNLTKQKAYGDARNSAIQAGGAEQSRLFGIGLQANQAGESNALNQFNTGLQTHTAGINDALANFNTGLQARQQGVSEATALHNAPLNDLSVLRGVAPVQLPTYPGQVGTSIPGVDYLNAANLGYNANLALNNANSANSANFTNGLFGLGSAALQGGLFNGLFGTQNNNSNSFGGQ